VTKIRRTYSLDETIVAKLRELADWKRRDMSSQLATMIERDHAQEALRRKAQPCATAEIEER